MKSEEIIPEQDFCDTVGASVKCNLREHNSFFQVAIFSEIQPTQSSRNKDLFLGRGAEQMRL